jgi:Fic family protein
MGVALLRENIGNKSNVSYSGLFGKFKITNAATGLVLALFGAFILGYALFKQIDIKQVTQDQQGKVLIDIQAKIDKLNEKGPISKADLEVMVKEVTEEINKNKRTAGTGNTTNEVKYGDANNGTYTGGKVKVETIQSLFKLIKTLKAKPSTIDAGYLSELTDIYTDIYKMNAGNALLKNYSPNAL